MGARQQKRSAFGPWDCLVLSPSRFKLPGRREWSRDNCFDIGPEVFPHNGKEEPKAVEEGIWALVLKARWFDVLSVFHRDMGVSLLFLTHFNQPI